MNKNIGLFYKCIYLIPDPKFRELVEEVLTKAPDDYFKNSASATGKYHPVDERSDWGLELHTKRVFKMAFESLRKHGIDDAREQSVVLVAALLHDTPFRFTEVNGKIKTNINHALDNAVFVQGLMRRAGFRDLSVKLVGAAIGFHSGKYQNYKYNQDWYNDHRDKEKHRTVLAVQDADFYASRSCVLVDVSGL